MWLTSSSIGRKFVMALTGICLVLFVTFHVLMNAVALIWPAAYNSVCEFLGANWYALVASAGLALLFIIHIVYACWLTIQNNKARGASKYAVTSRPPQVEWASKNMLVLGLVIVAFLVVHMIQFWSKMQLQELLHNELSVLPKLNGAPVPPAMGTLLLQAAFSQIWTPIVYIIGFVALWFHMNHGFWSMLHSCGLNNQTWMPRLKAIGCWWTSIVVGLFIVQAVVFTVQAKRDFYTNDAHLQEQYAEYWDTYTGEMTKQFLAEFQAAVKPEADKMQELQQQMATANPEQMQQLQAELQQAQAQAQEAQQKFLEKNGAQFVENVTVLETVAQQQYPDAAGNGENMQRAQQIKQGIQQMLGQSQSPF